MHGHVWVPLGISPLPSGREVKKTEEKGKGWLLVVVILGGEEERKEIKKGRKERKKKRGGGGQR